MDKITILEQQAIEAAISTRWEDAVRLNLEIIKLDKKNIDAYLRLGFAYLQLKNFNEAKNWYQKTLKLQPGNQTAIENLERIKILVGKKLAEKPIILNPDLFLEIAGKTKSVHLVNLGQKNILAELTVGQPVFLRQKRRRIEIRTGEKEYIGCLPDDLSRRLLILMKAGSEFSAHIKEAGLKKVVIFLREVKRGKKVLKYLPFPTNLPLPTELPNIGEKSEESEQENEELSEADLERLAEELEIKEKEDYLPFPTEEEEEEEEVEN